MKNNKTFAFKLAQKNQVASKDKKKQWKAREGVAVAGCTYSKLWGDVAYADGDLLC